MKKIMKVIILVSILVSNIAFAQDKYPLPLKFNYYNRGILYTNHPLDGTLFTQDSFWLGTQWGGHPRMLRALKMNANHGNTKSPPPTDSLMNYIWAEYKGITRAKGFQFEPTLYIPNNHRGDLITRNSQIWGFSRVLGDITNDTTDENYDRLSLYNNGSYVDSIVLAKSWINNQYLLANENNNNANTNGVNWNFSINLRRIDRNETSIGHIPVLTIKLPYKLVEDSINTFYIKFNQTSKNINHRELLSYSPEIGVIDTLGYSLLMDTLVTNVTEFVIYDDMLPDSLFYVNNKRQDITLNAYLIADGDADNNPFFKRKNGIEGIDSLDIEVTYHGNTDIAINHLRIATVGGEEFFKGKNYNSYRRKTQEAFDSLYSQNYEIYGMYGQDEYPIEYFSAQRYNAHLLNFQTINEGAGGEHVDHYIEHIQPQQTKKPTAKPSTKASKNTKIECVTTLFKRR